MPSSGEIRDSQRLTWAGLSAPRVGRWTVSAIPGASAVSGVGSASTVRRGFP